MLAYKFDKETKEFKGVQNAQINPLEGGYLLPANSTFMEVPKTKEGQTAVFSGENWVIKTDWRGHYQVKLDDMTFSIVDYIGEVKEGYQFITDEEYTKYQADREAFKVINGAFVDITDTEEYQEILLTRSKNSKIIENDAARDEKLNGGVIYKSVLFDSDTDQKVNLLATVQRMDEEQTIVWYGMDNKPLVCSKEDLINIGGLITSLHSFCWNKNAEIKQEIASCLTVDEVEAVEINYTQSGLESEGE